MFDIQAIPAFSDNYIWCLCDRSSGKALVVDPGQAQPVEDYLQSQQLVLDTILVTHHHPDHTGGITSLAKSFPDVRITGPADSPFKGTTNPIHPGDDVVWQGLTFKVMAVPGHTLDHVAYYSGTDVDGRPVLFCGDTLFVCGCGRLFEGKPEQMRQSLESLRALPDQTGVYCAHEYTLANLRFARSWLPDDKALEQFEQECQARRVRGEPTVPSSIGAEKALNPFMRWDQQEVIESARRYAASQGLPCDSANAVFAAIRHGKDHF